MRIFVAPGELIEGEVVVRGDEHHYVSRVRRSRVGDAIELVDGEGRRAAAVIARLEAERTVVIAGAPEAIAAALPRVRVLLPLIKGERMDDCIEKLVEVGADELVVWPAARSVVKLDDSRRTTRLAHYEAVAKAAARQSGRATTPDVALAQSLSQALAELPAGAKLVLDPSADRGELALADAGRVTVASGPEGGLTPGELDALAAAGFASFGLGPRVLRAETAPVVAVALVRAATST